MLQSGRQKQIVCSAPAYIFNNSVNKNQKTFQLVDGVPGGIRPDVEHGELGEIPYRRRQATCMYSAMRVCKKHSHDLTCIAMVKHILIGSVSVHSKSVGYEFRKQKLWTATGPSHNQRPAPILTSILPHFQQAIRPTHNNNQIAALTHSLTHSLTHPLTHSLTHPLTHSLTQPLNHSITHSLTHSPRKLLPSNRSSFSFVNLNTDTGMLPATISQSW